MLSLYKHRLCASVIVLILPKVVGAGTVHCCDNHGQWTTGPSPTWISEHVVEFVFIILGSILALLLISMAICCFCPFCILAQKRKRRGMVRSNPVGIIVASQPFPPPHASYQHQQYQGTIPDRNLNTVTNMYPPLQSGSNTANMGFSSLPQYTYIQTGPIKY